jgi:hypothetical protein
MLLLENFQTNLLLMSQIHEVVKLAVLAISRTNLVVVI